MASAINLRRRAQKNRHPSPPAACTHRSYQGVQEASPHAGADVTDGQDKACWHTFLLWVMRQGQVCLGHADGQIPKALGKERNRSRTNEKLTPQQRTSGHCDDVDPSIYLKHLCSLYNHLHCTALQLSYYRPRKGKESVG